MTKCSLDTVSCRSSYNRRVKRGRKIEKRPRTIHCQALTLIKTIGCCVEFSRHQYWACFKRWFTYFMTSYKHFILKKKILNMFLRDFWKALFSRNVYKANHVCIQKYIQMLSLRKDLNCDEIYQFHSELVLRNLEC